MIALLLLCATAITFSFAAVVFISALALIAAARRFSSAFAFALALFVGSGHFVREQALEQSFEKARRRISLGSRDYCRRRCSILDLGFTAA